MNKVIELKNKLEEVSKAASDLHDKLYEEASNKANAAYSEVMAPVEALDAEREILRAELKKALAEEARIKNLEYAGTDTPEEAISNLLADANAAIKAALELRPYVTNENMDFRLDIGYNIYLGGPQRDKWLHGAKFNDDEWYASYSSVPLN